MNDLLNVEMAPGLILCKPTVVNPKETYGDSGLINPGVTAKNATFNQIKEIYEEHPFQAEILCVSKVGVGATTAPSEWLKPGDHIYMNRECGKNDVVLIKDNGVYAYIRPSDVICKIKKTNIL
jgi:hypothetical protein